MTRMIPLFCGITDPITVTPEELLALKAFGYVVFYDKEGEFHTVLLTNKATVLRFLKAYGGRP